MALNPPPLRAPLSDEETRLVNRQWAAWFGDAWRLLTAPVTTVASVAWGAITGSITDQADLQAALDAKVDTTRNVSATGPLTGGGPLSSDVVIGVNVASNDSTGVVKPDTTTITVDAIGMISVGTIPESSVTSLVSDLAAKVTANVAIVGATKTKITYDTKGLVTAGADAAISDLSDGSSKTTYCIGITIDGGSSTPTTGSKGFCPVPFSGTITEWTLIADASGSAQITVKLGTPSGDTNMPTRSSIVASDPPSLSSQQRKRSTSLSGWTTTVTANDVMEFNLDSVTTCARLTLILKVTRT